MKSRCASITAAQYYGDDLTGTSAAEGSVMAYHPAVPVCDDPFAAAGAEKWRTVPRYVLVASCDDLAREYNMRFWIIIGLIALSVVLVNPAVDHKAHERAKAMFS